jgi:hypothetical protein
MDGATFRRLLIAALVAALVLGIASGAQADRGRYVARSFTEPAKPGLSVTGPLADLRAVSGARVVVPSEWRRLGAKSGRLRFLTQGSSCRYLVTFSVRSRLAAPQDPPDYVAAALPSPASRRLLDSGQRRSSAFRVVHEPGSATGVSLAGLRASVLTKRADIAPAGQVAWSELSVSATSRPGDECHSGTYRDVLGPQLGDTLATVRTRLRFVKP